MVIYEEFKKTGKITQGHLASPGYPISIQWWQPPVPEQNNQLLNTVFA